MKTDAGHSLFARMLSLAMALLLLSQPAVLRSADATPTVVPSSPAAQTAAPADDSTTSRAAEDNLNRAVNARRSDFLPASRTESTINRSVIGNLPDLGDASNAAMSEVEERQQAEQAMQEIRRDPDYIADPLLTDYLNSLGFRLARAVRASGLDSAPSFDFFAVRDKGINAFAMPGGYVGVYTGLMVAAENESELAAVVGHEIGHVLQKHYARGQDRNRGNVLMALGGLALAILAASHNPSAATGLAIGGQAAAADNYQSFSRDAEREADRVGYQILQAGGFDTSASPAFFSWLQRANNINESNIPSYVRTHPLTVDRIADMQARAQQTAKQPVQPQATEFYYARARARVLQTPSPVALADLRNYFQQQKSAPLKPEVQAGNLYGLAYVNEQIGDFAAMRRALDELEALVRSPAIVEKTSPAIEVMELEFAASGGKMQEAVQEAEKALKQFPASRAVGVAYVRLLLLAHRPADAVGFLQARTRLEPGQSAWWDLLAESFAAQGKRAAQHRALAESMMLQGAWPSALEQLKIARAAGDANFYELSEIDARIHQLQNDYKDQLGPRTRR
ncbi:MAG: M48 family metalloprotease [Candidatus Protistobacter heckmanni]|nr:M48 family metalloprotease [Candidatus Protistobacter heckmanni]